MKAFIAIVKSTAGVLEKFQDFDAKEEADAHVVEFGGFVASNPGGDNRKYWVIDEAAGTIGYDQPRQDQEEASRVWQTAMLDTDTAMPRPIENVVASMDAEQYARLDQYTRDAYEAKIVVRATQPKSE